MSTPAIIWLVLSAMTLTVKALNHGKPKTENVLTYLLVDLPIVAGLLYWGGFFS